MNTRGKASTNRIKQRQRARGRIQVTTVVWNDVCVGRVRVPRVQMKLVFTGRGLSLVIHLVK